MSQQIILPVTTKMPRGLRTQDVYFDTHPVGPLEGFTVMIRPEDVIAWNHIYDDESSAPYAPSTILYYPSQHLMGREFHSGGGFARYQADFREPLPIGRPLTITGEVERRFLKRGRCYYQWRMTARDGDTIVQRSWKQWSFRVTPEQAAGLPELPSDDPSSWDGRLVETLGPLPLDLTITRLSAFEGPGEVNSHTSQEMAEQAGFPAPLAQGAISFGLLYRLVRDRFGLGFIQGGTLDVRFIRPSWAGQTVTASGEVTQIQDGLATCRLRVENADGMTLSAGTATARA